MTPGFAAGLPDRSRHLVARLRPTSPSPPARSNGSLMGRAVRAVLHALGVAGSMTWQVTWSLILGFTLSAIIEALVRKSTIVRLLPDDRPRSLAIASGL